MKKKNHKPRKNQTEEGEKITNPQSITQVLEKKKKNHNPAAFPHIGDNREKRRHRLAGGRSRSACQELKSSGRRRKKNREIKP